MPSRKPTLEEWFLVHQLDRLRRDHYHLPFHLDVDLTRVTARYGEGHRKVPITAILVKAAALTVVRHPEVNRAVFRTPLGLRILEPSEVAVNLPMVLERSGKAHLTATAIPRAHRLSIGEIQQRIREALAREVSELPVGRFVFGRPNHVLNRLRLRIIRATVQALPSIYERGGGGGISVSSLINVDPGDWDMRMMAYGPTALTVSTCSLRVVDGASSLRLGIGYDHNAIPGQQAVTACRTLATILRAEDPEHLEALTS